MLLFGILAITDKYNTPTDKDRVPLMVALLVLAIGNSDGTLCGFPINPARDFGPRFFSLIIGYGGEVFSAYNYWFWIPIIAPCIGGVLGASIYSIFVGVHHP